MPPDHTAAEPGLSTLAQDTLVSLERISTRASEALSGARGVSAGVLVNPGTCGAVDTLGGITYKAREDYERLAREPAVARLLVVDEDDKKQIIYVARAAPAAGLLPNIRVASYLSPMGRLAAVPVGKEVDIAAPGGEKSYEVLERAKLKPIQSGREWDSNDTVLERPKRAPLTIRSLRALLGAPSREGLATSAPETSRPEPQFVPQREPDGEELLDSLLRSTQVEQNQFEGIRRSVITKMGLRDRPVLDSFQDEIFRLALNTRLVITGPPGTGKTTTLIKRLAQKVNWEFLTPEERRLVERSRAGQENHATSWLVITPTELLRLYVKEAFAHEGVAAPDFNIKTWDDVRLDLARNVFGILGSATRSGAVMDQAIDSLQPDTFSRQREWYEAFVIWNRSAFLEDLKEPVKLLIASRDAHTAQIGQRLRKIIEISKADQILQFLARLDSVADDAGQAATRLREDTSKALRKEFSAKLINDRGLLDKLLAFLITLDDREAEDPEDEGDADDPPQLLKPKSREDAFNAYVEAMRALAAARVDGKSLASRSRKGRLADWLGDRIPAGERLLEIGKLHKHVAALRRFSNPLRSYSDGLIRRYRRFRREQMALDRWYRRAPAGSNELHPLEVDLLLCNLMAYARALVADPGIEPQARARSLPILQGVDQVRVNQILIDEVADFSPLQIACMAQLCDPSTASVLACGDLNQRITTWGSRTQDDLAWALPGLLSRSVAITYRHSKQIQSFIERLLKLSGVPQDKSALPGFIDNEVVAPALLLSASGPQLADWIVARVREIEQMVSPARLPSIAVLVNSESEVMPLADAIDKALKQFNIRCVGCKDGAVKGQDSDVRVFDIKHIKGLEFEAVFFVNVDELAARSQDLFEKYLYVGTTRAAVYLGLTCSGPKLPTRIAQLRSSFVEGWRA